MEDLTARPAPTDTDSRLVRLELLWRYERERVDMQVAHLSHRLQALETTTGAGQGGHLKLAIAIGLPFAVLALTGDLKAAVRALRFIFGAPT